MKIHNFSAGPAILPSSVFEKAAQACVDYENSGLSLLELSHRGPEFSAIMSEARNLVIQLTGLSEDYEVLFLTGGASSQFYMIPMNLLNSNEVSAYVNSGRWAANAVKEAANFGEVDVVASAEDNNYRYLPKFKQLDKKYKYLHITSNNTVAGTQYHDIPEVDCPLICDMSSDIFSKSMDFSKFDLIYAGAQKNIGPAGTTLVIIKKSLLEDIDRKIPTMLKYETHIKKGSMYNTPPVFPIYVSMLTMRWIVQEGGLKVMEARNLEKSTLIYNEIDRNPLIEGMVAAEDRSRMNVTFRFKDDSLTTPFLQFAEKLGCVGLKGHRSVGGLRASMYNALPLSSVETLVDVLQKFEKSTTN